MRGRMTRSLQSIAFAAALGFAASVNAAPPPEGASNVAMGSSYAAGPGIAEMAPDSPGRCGQSTLNYARQVARAFKLKLVDRSCSGATTADILGSGPTHRPPQLAGLTPDTRLVTVTVGGNDVRYMADFSVAVCAQDPESLPETMRAQACARPATFSVEQAFAAVDANLRAIASEVRRRSPQARLVFVDYVTVLPPRGTCAAVAIAAHSADELRARAKRLADLTARVARENSADLVKASELTRVHDACATDPWTAGLVRQPFSAWGATSFHPSLAAMNTIAKALIALVQK